MAEEQEITARLKARLDKWNAYNQHAETTAAPIPPPVEKVATQFSGDPELEPITSAKMLVSLHTLSRQHASVVEPDVVDPVSKQRDSYIADLQAAVEHERERNQELAQAVRREQALHYITMNTEAPARIAAPAVPEPPAPQPSRTHYAPDLFMENGSSHSMGFTRTIPLIIAVVLILGVWAAFNFVN